MSGDQACPTCGDPIIGKAGFYTVGNTDYVCTEAHNDGSAPEGAPKIGDQADLAKDDTPTRMGEQRPLQLRLGPPVPPPLARGTDPSTSADASTMRARTGQRAVVLEDQHRHPAGLTDDEGSAMHPEMDPRSYSKRRGELEREGLIVATSKRRLTRRNRWAVVYRLAAGAEVAS